MSLSDSSDGPPHKRARTCQLPPMTTVGHNWSSEDGFSEGQGDSSMIEHAGSVQSEDFIPSPTPDFNRSRSPTLEEQLNTFTGPLDCDVLIIGSGPAGLLLACTLARYGVDFIIVDDRTDKTEAGRADGLQPKTIETLKHLGLADELLSKGVKVYEISFWNSTEAGQLGRTGRQTHYPSSSVDTLDPYILLVHQGMVEDVFIKDLASRNRFIKRNTSFIASREGPHGSNRVNALVKQNMMGESANVTGYSVYSVDIIKAKFVIGCDGAHSRVRQGIPQEKMTRGAGTSAWGVIDGVLNTNFPDIWTKAVVQSSTAGSLLCIPRERNLTRLYVELGQDAPRGRKRSKTNQDLIMRRAQEIISPYSIEWNTIEWSSVYVVSQRVCSSFVSDGETIYLVGDAAHTHSPKAAQGMNVSMHDAFNLSWKLKLFLQSIAQSSLLKTYEEERGLVAHQLIEFDIEHAEAFQSGSAAALAENFNRNIRFISGIGVQYDENIVNVELPAGIVWQGQAKVGALLPPARVTRFIDSNPVDIQLDIPLLGQFRIYILVPNIHNARDFLQQFIDFLVSNDPSDGSITGQASILLKENSYGPPDDVDVDGYRQIGRYTTISRLFTPAVVTTMNQDEVEISQLPSIMPHSPWTFYLDSKPHGSCTQKWAGNIIDHEVVIINVRPDGYVCSMNRFFDNNVEGAKAWLNGCFTFLKDFKAAGEHRLKHSN